MPTDVTTIVLTGGPCGGKTTALAHLEWELPRHGVRVITVPEAARMLMSSGLIPAQVGWGAFQEAILRTQLAHEDTFRSLASRYESGPTVMLCDRGAIDNRAYVSEEVFQNLLDHVGVKLTEVRDNRYDAVLHLLTAASGAEAHYVQDNERLESLEDARRLDQATQHAWVGHPHLRVIDNSTDFEGKKQRVLDEVLRILGLPVPLEIERKYIIERWVLKKLPAHAQMVEVEQYYLDGSGDAYQERIRRRTQHGCSVFYRTYKVKVGTGVNEEREWRITEEEFNLERDTRALTRVCKNRWCFLYEHQYFELDDFSPMGRDLCLMELELTHEQQTPVFPDWMGKVIDVTDNPSYGNYALAFPV
ncbi:MAG TPA: AAA family ATPase [Candidatus Paceibacterota bacterium]|nr:AAA family ATPase [Candidatus Paceibacterota bacterium]